jgi:RluA family pseudouridine synthase
MPKDILHKVPAHTSAISLVSYCIDAFPVLGSRSAVKKAIYKGRLFLNDRPAQLKDLVETGDMLRLQRVLPRTAKKPDKPVQVIYEDDDLLVVNKPAGMAVNGLRNKTVENAVVDSIGRNPNADALTRPVAVHRIDVPTRGIVVLAKTKTALIKLSRSFQQRHVKKEYVALVHGKVPKSGTIVSPIEEKRSVTEYQLIESVPSRVFGHLSLARVFPVTGRTHQIRIHMKRQGHLIVGDKMYAEGQKTILGKGLFLCARAIEFRHPSTGKTVSLEVPVPGKFLRVLERERERYD